VIHAGMARHLLDRRVSSTRVVRAGPAYGREREARIRTVHEQQKPSDGGVALRLLHDFRNSRLAGGASGSSIVQSCPCPRTSRRRRIRGGMAKIRQLTAGPHVTHSRRKRPCGSRAERATAAIPIDRAGRRFAEPPAADEHGDAHVRRNVGVVLWIRRRLCRMACASPFR